MPGPGRRPPGLPAVAAACPELVHRTRKVFDDIQDRTTTRNSRPALWEKYGIEQSLNAGLALSACARMALTNLTGPSFPEGLPIRILEVLERSLVLLCWGQCLDPDQQTGGPLSLQEYMQMVALKTGTLVGACCEVTVHQLERLPSLAK